MAKTAEIEAYRNRRGRAVAYLWADRHWPYTRIGQFFGYDAHPHRFVSKALGRARRLGLLVDRNPLLPGITRMARKHWRPDEVATLVRMWGEGKTQKEIAAALPGRTVSQVAGRIATMRANKKAHGSVVPHRATGPQDARPRKEQPSPQRVAAERPGPSKPVLIGEYKFRD